MMRSPVRERLAFLIVGTPRSGTTLVQRLATELPDVRVPPETHFFDLVAAGLLRRRRFPLSPRELHDEIRSYLDLRTSRGMSVQPEEIASLLDGECASPVDLFAAITQALAGDGGALLGEKTPTHLLWWKPISRALPSIRIVAVVRDPRAVVNSYATAPFGMSSHVALAERWSADQRLVLAAREQLGSERVLVLRYEDVVASPDGARGRMASFLGIEMSDGTQASEPAMPLFMPWEEWKRPAIGPIVRDRVDAWRASLSRRQIGAIEWVCQREMRIFGYEPDEGGRGLLSHVLSPADRWRRRHFRLARASMMREIEATTL